MKTYRLSPFTIFVSLLAVILIGFLMNHVWETFQGRMNSSQFIEGFETDYTKTNTSTTLLGYSTNSRKIVDLENKLFFDPVAKILVYKKDELGNFEMKARDGNTINFDKNTSTENKVKLIGNVILTNDSFIKESPSPALTSFTIDAITNAFKSNTDISYVYMEVSGNPVSNSDIKYIKTNNSVLADTSANYPIFTATDSNYVNLYIRTKEFKNFDPTSHENTSPANIAWKPTNSNIQVVAIPFKTSDGVSSSVTFIHMMNVSANQHLATYYFNGNEMHGITYVNKKIVPNSDSVDVLDKLTGNSANTSSFDGNLSDITLSITQSNQDLKTELKHENKMIYIAGGVNSNKFRAYITINSTTLVPSIQSFETSVSSSNNNTGNSGTSSSGSGSGSNTITELTNAMNLLKSMKGLFGSPDSDYLLKTEVVPPVCPSCPSCSSNKGVCTNCGGHGGSGTQTSSGSGSGSETVSSLIKDAGSGTTNLIRDGASGATTIARDAASGTYGVGKDIVSGTRDTIANTASGVGNFAKDSASGVGNFAKDAASGAYGAASDVTKGTVGLLKDTVSGTVGLGREVAQGVGGWFGPSTANGGYQNSYGGPSYYNQGGYMNPQAPATAGQDPYSYYGAVPPRYGGCNYKPVTANFSSFGR
jgi:hypothetical protein